MSEVKKTDELTKSILIFVRDHWALVASVGYLYLSIMGMSQAYFFYHSFGINIFEFSELNDFALAAFKEPKTLLYGLGIVVYVGVVSLVAQLYIKMRASKSDGERNLTGILQKQMKAMTVMVVPVILLVPVILPNMVNDSYDDFWKDEYVSNKGNEVDIKLRVSSVHKLPGGDITGLSMLGTTDKYTFFYSKETKKVLIIPINNLLLVKHN